MQATESLGGEPAMEPQRAAVGDRLPVGASADPQRITAAGIRRLEGKHLTLYTDLEPDPEVDCLPEVFDLAFEPFCVYFALDPDKHASWKMTGRLMRDAERFRRAGLLPEGLPKFANGFTKSYDFWIYEQPSTYYRRHLMLHEGVHGLMLTLLGSCGPTWYMEGIAELLATHRWEEGKLVVKYLPRSSEEAPMWGRVKIVRDSAQRRGLLSVEELIQMTPKISGENELYGWCWALAAFLDNHPRYQSQFRQMVAWVRAEDFTQRFFRSLGENRPLLDEEWKLFVDEICYGYDFGQCAIEFLPGRPIPAEGVEVRVQADRGWQSSAWRVEAGRTYRLIASGRYQVAQQPRIWWCEPGGVSIQYYRGRPLGMLLAAVRPEDGSSGGGASAKGLGSSSEERSFSERSGSSGGRRIAEAAPSEQAVEPTRTGLLHPIPIGLEAKLRPTASGVLYFRINESPARLSDNAGELVVRIQPEK